MRRRIWCELLPPEQLGEDATIALLEKYRLEPIVALPPVRQTEALFSALEKLSARKIKIGLWPLLDDEDGYWPSLHNAETFADRVARLLPILRERRIPVSTMAFDLEPPLEVMRAFMNGGLLQKTKAMAAGLVDLVRVAQPKGAEVLPAIEAELRGQGIETLAAAMPTLILDLASRSVFWERVFQTPLALADWSVVSPMLYTTLIVEHLPSKDADTARALLFQFSRLLVEAVGPARASVSLGLVTTGKFGNEPFYDSPEALRLDVEAARAAGVDDLALFSLEGVLSRGAPEAWLEPFTRAEARAPDGSRGAVVSSLVRGAAWLSTPLGWIR